MKRTICIFLSLLFCLVPATAEDLGLNTVVIDPGHGGKDPGCVSADGKTLEKNITLDIAKSLAAKIRAGYPEVNVILTRTTDVFVPLNERANIANKAHAGLFISIHINASTSKSPNGYSLHILGEKSSSNRDLYAYNMDVCKRENEVILLEEDYSTKYQGFDPNDPESFIFMSLMQNAYREQSLRFAEEARKSLKTSSIKADRGIWQNAFVVLINTSMPSVLVELGFMSNAADLANLRQKGKRDELAECLFKAFSEYKKVYDSSISAPAAGGRETLSQKPAPKGDKVDSGGTVYAVQIFASSARKSDKSLFMGYEPKEIYDGKLYKYYISVSSDASVPRMNLKKIRTKYPDAFVVKIEDGKVTKF